MTFADAQIFKMPFGKHKGLTLDKISETDEGLLYLDWLVGKNLNPYVKQALETYLAYPSIQRDVAALLYK